jgi:hypothetical protein
MRKPFWVISYRYLITGKIALYNRTTQYTLEFGVPLQVNVTLPALISHHELRSGAVQQLRYGYVC